MTPIPVSDSWLLCINSERHCLDALWFTTYISPSFMKPSSIEKKSTFRLIPKIGVAYRTINGNPTVFSVIADVEKPRDSVGAFTKRPTTLIGLPAPQFNRMVMMQIALPHSKYFSCNTSSYR